VSGLIAKMCFLDDFGAKLSINMISYEDFGKLRFLDFFPQNSGYAKDTVGGSRCAIGFACVEGYAFTYFSQPMSNPSETAEIALDFTDDCPEREGNEVLCRIGLGIRKGLSLEEVIALIGNPMESDTHPLWPRFLIGGEWRYYVSCEFTTESGLASLIVARKDIVDRTAETFPET